jgi:hypothetical protein
MTCECFTRAHQAGGSTLSELLLTLASAVNLGSESSGTHDSGSRANDPPPLSLSLSLSLSLYRMGQTQLGSF